MPVASLAQLHKIRHDSAHEPLVYDGVHADLCPALIEIIERHRKTIRQYTGSLNVGGWKSPESFFTWPEPEVAELERAFVNVLGARPIGWAMINGPGAQHKRHQHRIAIVSGIYYLDSSRTPTLFELADKSKLEIDPAPGRLVVFPGETWHMVPVVTDQRRVTVAFDVRR